MSPVYHKFNFSTILQNRWCLVRNRSNVLLILGVLIEIILLFFFVLSVHVQNNKLLRCITICALFTHEPQNVRQWRNRSSGQREATSKTFWGMQYSFSDD
jgi:hypothetical protein